MHAGSRLLLYALFHLLVLITLDNERREDSKNLLLRYYTTYLQRRHVTGGVCGSSVASGNGQTRCLGPPVGGSPGPRTSRQPRSCDDDCDAFLLLGLIVTGSTL